jgi:hypothetical protein
LLRVRNIPKDATRKLNSSQKHAVLGDKTLNPHRCHWSLLDMLVSLVERTCQGNETTWNPKKRKMDEVCPSSEKRATDVNLT